MNRTLIKSLILIFYCSITVNIHHIKAQSSSAHEQEPNFHELKNLILKQKSTAESILGIKKFSIASSKESAENTGYVFKNADGEKISIKIRKLDGLVIEVIWNEVKSSIGNLTHDAVYDGFAPMMGNTKYVNRLENIALFIDYAYANSKTVPCAIKLLE